MKNKGMMRSLVMAIAAVASLAAVESVAAQVNVNINGYLPAPPGVEVRVSAGRPYYMERGRPVYLVERPRHRKHRHGPAYVGREWYGYGYGRGHDHGRHRGHEGR